jgi:hypothetical protein
MSDAITTTGTRFYIRNAGGTDIEIEGHQSFSPPNGQRNVKDRTSLKDDEEVIALGIRRGGEGSLSILHIEDASNVRDPGQVELEAAYEDGAKRTFTWVLPTGAYRQYTVHILNFPFEDGNIDSDYKGTINLRQTGTVTKGTSFTPAP